MTHKLQCGPFGLALGGRTLIMGILNVTPDSFSDGGRYLKLQPALERALAMQAEGADLIDIGGESTRPGARPVSVREEMRRVIPVIERLSRRLKIPISIDTSKASVAEAALRAGASMVNDITALGDPRMASVVAKAGIPVILMHMRGTPRTMQRAPFYRRLIPEILTELRRAVRKARAAGIAREKILIDPGFGFGKRYEDNFKILKHLSTFQSLGFPLVIGPSRKSFIGLATRTEIPDRVFGTAAAVALGVLQGAEIVRVHDVSAMRQAALVAAAVARS